MIYDLQKASMWKRISAYIFDSILLAVLAVGFALVISEITNYNSHTTRLSNYYLQYGNEYGIDLNISSADYEKLTEDQLKQYEEALKAMNADQEVVRTYSLVINLSLVIVTLGVLFSMLLLEYLVPLLFKNGQTLGKKAFGIGVMRTDGVKINSILLFIRTILGKFTIETMIPVLMVIMIFFGQAGGMALMVIAFILLLQLAIVCFTRNHYTIHDLLAKTVAVDIASQMIFDTEADMIAYKERIHAEQAARQDY